MAVALADLVESTKASLNAPGDKGFFNFDPSVTDEWIAALGNAFWWANVRGFFKDYRVTLDRTHIENVVGGPDLDRTLQQVIVLFCSLIAIEAKLIALPTVVRDSAKPGLETERQRSAQLLRDLLKARRDDLAEIKLLLVGGVWATDVLVIDQFLARDARLISGSESFIAG